MNCSEVLSKVRKLTFCSVSLLRQVLSDFSLHSCLGFVGRVRICLSIFYLNIISPKRHANIMVARNNKVAEYII